MTLALLDEAGSAATVASAGGRYFGLLSAAPIRRRRRRAGWPRRGRNAALPVMLPVAARLHDVVTGWLTELLGCLPGARRCS